MVHQLITEGNFCCAIVPTYNNANTLEKVITDVAQYIPHIIVVNDGSTDHTKPQLSLIQQNSFSHFTLDVVHFPENKGKGKALRKGFERASQAGFRYAITIDADGQHFADDIPALIEMIQEYPDSLIVGARNMQQEGVPVKSSFGNRFSNFWYRVETGIKLPDTQSGFRLYPLELFSNTKFFTGKYEFEIEVLVRAAWRGYTIQSIPIHTYYETEDNRVSHFRPFCDFARISLLNTVLVFIALLWIKPRDMICRLSWKKLKHFVYKQFLTQNESALHVALSTGFGIFMGNLPIWGFQLLSALAIAHFLKLNKAIVFVTANISIPPMIPVLLYIHFTVGGWIVNNPSATASLDIISLEIVKRNLYQYLVGSVFFSVVSGIAVTLVVWLAVSVRRRSQFRRSLCQYKPLVKP